MQGASGGSEPLTQPVPVDSVARPCRSVDSSRLDEEVRCGQGQASRSHMLLTFLGPGKDLAVG